MQLVRLTALGATLVLAALALAACGSSSDSSKDQDDITAAITKSATSGDPAACTEVQTQQFTEQTSGPATGAAAVKSCEKDAADAASDSADVTDIKVDGKSATAVAAFTGGFIDGQSLDISLVKDGDQWKVDKLEDFAKFDRDTFVTAVEGVITSQFPQSAPCIKEQLGKASDQQLQDAVLTPTGGDTLFAPCSGG